MRYFTVKETRDAGDRLRPIMWPWLNLLMSVYKSAHKLRTVEQYRLLALQQAVSLCFDLQASFWQVLLPSTSKLVIVTEDGRILRMKRIPYGHDAASEIMHIITSTLAGDPTYCKAEYSAGNASAWNDTTAVHIDNVMFVGPQATDRAATFVKNCDAAGVQLNVEPGNEPSAVQEFVGMRFDFNNHTVALAKKLETLTFILS
jgi:hypothetical protein